MPSVITIQRIPMLVNSGENLIESLMGSSQVALSRRLTTENKVEHKKDGRSFVSFTSYKMLHITPFTTFCQVISLNFEFNTLFNFLVISFDWIAFSVCDVSSIHFVEFKSKSHFELLSVRLSAYQPTKQKKTYPEHRKTAEP